MRVVALFIIGMAVCSGHAGPRTYLATLGPAPLRFVAPAPSLPTAAPLPPEKTASQRPAKSEPGEVAFSEGQTPLGKPAIQEGQAAPATRDDSLGLTNTFPLALDNQATPLISPQSLLQFFVEPGFTNAPAGITVPISFQPAMPPLTKSSSATYQSSSPEP
jgi:hypothetical protein